MSTEFAPSTQPLPTDAPRRSVETVCGYCGVGCGITLEVVDGTVAKARGTASHPANHGRLCTKGATTTEMLKAPGRLTTATVRHDRNAEPRTTPIDEAITETARRLSAIRTEHGPDAVALYVSGQMSLEAQYLANKLAKGFLGTNQIESNSRLCMASAGTGYKQSLGADGPPGSYDDLDHADAFLVIGSNMADCHPILFLRLLDRVAAGAKLIVVDPRRTATANKAHLHLPVRPGTDLALLNGLLQLIVEAGGVDDEFIAAHTEGWDETLTLLADYPADRVAELTGVDESMLREAAQILASADNWMSLWTMGLNQSTHGTWNTNAICNLHLATGTICRTGSGPFSLTGQPNAMGGREMGYMGPGLPGQRTVANADHRAETERIWKIPAGTLHTGVGCADIEGPGSGGTIDMFASLANGGIRAIWIICTNPVASVANRATVVQALEAAELVVVQEAFSGAETTAFADIVLPAALWAEAEGTMVNSERSVMLTQPAVTPPGQALPDWQIIARVACEMGFADAFDYPDAAAVFDEITAFHNPTTGWDFRGIDYARLAAGPVQWPAAPGGPARNPIRYVDDGTLTFPTASGRARFWARPHLPPAEMPDDDYPMLLTTGRLAHQWHTMTKTGRVAKLNRLDPHSFVQINPADATASGIAEGDLVELRSRRGTAQVPARVDDAVAPGVCFVPMHWADSFGQHLAINAVTNDAVDPDSLQPEFKACAVSLTRLAPAASAAAPEERPTTAVELTPKSLAAALGVSRDEPKLSDTERGYLSGMLQGLEANPPVGAVPTVPERSPLSSLTRAWVEGVLAGYFSRVPANPTAGAAVTSIRVVWASQTGTAEEYAADASAELEAAGFAVTTVCADRVAIDDLAGNVVFIVASTGNGDAPDNGLALWDALACASANDIDELRYAVIGFGDSSYADFCGFARKLDARLDVLGGSRLTPPAFCEPDFTDRAATWLADTMAAVGGATSTPTVPEPASAAKAPEKNSYSKKHPYLAPIIGNSILTAPESDKQVRRITFGINPEVLNYTAGDALGVWPRNSDALVTEWLERTGLDGTETVIVDGEPVDLRLALSEHYEIARCTRDIVAFVASHHNDPELAALLDDPAAFAEWAWGRQSVDLLITHPVEAPAADWLSMCKRLQPRLYSISSSPSTTPDRVEATVSVVQFGEDLPRRGVCSGFLADSDPTSDVPPTARIFIQPNTKFSLPAEPDAPVIMIGPGTGIAPFRSFLHELLATGATGDNWVFFGERHRDTDFHYRDELLGFVESGLVTRLDTAFSRDQPEKVYVQDHMAANASEIWAWLRRGAHIYVCGDAKSMARDVDDCLHAIVAQHGRLAPSGVDAYVRALAADGRYVRDVY
ncbi:molybdopterin-dependent oxidoreductase [Gordonia sp. (in: high G+C Gram-positive bacteria)]|uniref:molybdopterin-dependent oxidoreductase n=1 Tax=Gordonia sp. (in: high G+C Gram-positive bacteria) TaxID=84139 RepID=UPI003C736A15